MSDRKVDLLLLCLSALGHSAVSKEPHSAIVFVVDTCDKSRLQSAGMYLEVR